MSDMRDPSQTEADPPIRFLKILVTVLAGTMIAGLITIIALIVIRFPAMTATLPKLPEGFTLPEGATAEAVTFGKGWIAVVTSQDEILILDPESGALRQRVQITP